MVVTPMDLSEECYAGEAMDVTMKVFVGAEDSLNICFSETFLTESNNEEYLNNTAYPNAAEVVIDRESLWLSMFTRHMKRSEEDEEETIYICAP